MKSFRIIPLALLISQLVFAQFQNESKILDQTIQNGMKDWKIPGLAAVVVKDGQVVFKKTYGVKSIETNTPIDENTLFAMASTTKATIAMAMGMLVDEGKMKWDDKVIDHLPDFQLIDPYITADARVKDLLTHNLGIANADMLWAIDSMSTSETLRRFSKTEKTYPLRGGFTYQNIMYAAAGELIASITGAPWNKFVQNRLFNPLGMNRSQTRAIDIYSAGNHVVPHYNFDEDGVQIVAINHSDQIGAAGMMWSSINDMSKYLKFLLAKGKTANDTLIQPNTFKELFKPQTLIPKNQFYPTAQLTKPNWTSYGLGWFQHDYRGEKLDFHTGSLQGLVAIAGVMHDKDVAVYVFANMDHAELRHAIMYQAMDLYAFEDTSTQWHRKIFEFYKKLETEGNEFQKTQEEKRIKGTKPSLELSSYVGEYTHPMCGKLTISIKDGGLDLNFNDFEKINAAHWHYDTFRTKTNKSWVSPILLTFKLDGSAQVETAEFIGYTFQKIN